MIIDPKKDDEKLRKFKSLSERTADEIFYDLISSHSKKIIGLLIFILCIGISTTYYWRMENENRQNISIHINQIIKKKASGADCRQSIQNCLKEIDDMSFKLMPKRYDSYRATLLLMEDLDNMNYKDFQEFLRRVNNLDYICQYIHTTNHFKRFSYVTEALYLKTLYFMGKKGYKDQMLNFFMSKKLHTSIMGHYMYYILSLFQQNRYMLNDMASSYQYMVTNIPEIVILSTKVGTNNA